MREFNIEEGVDDAGGVIVWLEDSNKEGVHVKPIPFIHSSDGIMSMSGVNKKFE